LNISIVLYHKALAAGSILTSVGHTHVSCCTAMLPHYLPSATKENNSNTVGSSHCDLCWNFAFRI